MPDDARAMQTSPEINEIADALAKAQAAIENVGKDGANPHFKSRYATLSAVLDEVRPKFAAQGIAIVQMAVNGEGSNIGVITRLAHRSGQWIESGLYVAPMKFDAQGAGSVISYLRRYSLMAMAGVGQDDDDGTAAVARPEAAVNGKAHAVPEERDPVEFREGAKNRTAVEREAQLATATAYKDEIKAGIEAAEEPAAIDRLLKTNGPKLEFIKQYHEATYTRLMGLAMARGDELRSGA